MFLVYQNSTRKLIAHNNGGVWILYSNGPSGPHHDVARNLKRYLKNNWDFISCFSSFDDAHDFIQS